MIFNPNHLDKINLPSGWKLELLGKYSNIVTSFKTFQKIKNEFEKNNDGLPIHYLKVSDMNIEGNKIFFLNSNNTFYSGVKKNFDKGFLKPNSLVFPKRGAAIATNKKRITSTFSVLDPNLIGVEPNNEIEINFLYLFFELFDLKWLQDNNVIPQLNKHNVAGVKFPLPTLPEQRKIAYVLNAMQKAIEQQDKLIRHTTELKKALMQKLFTEGTKGEKQKETEIGLVPESWQVIKIGDIIEKWFGGGTPSTKSIEYWKGNNPWITSKWLSDKLELENGEKFISDEGIKNSATSIVPSNSLIFATRVGVGKIGVNKINLSINQDLAGGQVKNIYDIYFIAYQFQMEKIQLEIESFKRGATIKGITRDNLKGIQLAIPKTKKEQEEISGVIKLMNSKIENHQKKKQTLSLLFKTLLHELMIGQRRIHEIDFLTVAKEYVISEQALGIAAEQ
jgi:restriction endonuclease S subunit